MCEISTDGEYADVWRETYQHARKAYKCAECRSPIAPGEQYLYHFSIADGDTSVVRNCCACAQIRDAFGEAHGFHPHPHVFYEYLNECIIGERPRRRGLEGDPGKHLAWWRAAHRKWKEETRQWRLGRAQIRLRRRAVKRMKT